MASTEEDLKQIYEVLDGPTGEMSTEDLDEAQSSLYDYALGMDARQETIITLSWGGPASYLEVTHRRDEIYTITYRFSDWFDTATQEITDQESAIWRYAQEMISIQEGAI
jgi:hypothetical protein